MVLKFRFLYRNIIPNKSTYRVVGDVDPYRFVLIVYLITVILFVLTVSFRAIVELKSHRQIKI